MCIVFVFNQDPHDLSSNFRLILAANRDEFFDRPAKQAHFWEDDPNILAGQDLCEGFVGGTWLGVTKTGKLSCLTNVLTGKRSNKAKQNRGFLISNFLRGSDDGLTYLCQLSGSDFRPFHLLMGNMLGDLYYMNNVDSRGAEVLRKGYSCLTNDYKLDSDWLKCTCGLQNFRTTVESVKGKKDLMEALLNVLEDATLNFPDPAIPSEYSLLNSTFIPTTKLSIWKNRNCGTRTNTIILVDKEGNVTFFERTMTAPGQPVEEWLRNTYTFKINED